MQRASFLNRWLHLQGNEPSRMMPFFGFYLVLFVMLSLGDGLSLSLFVERVGATHLPKWYAISSVCTVLASVAYLRFAKRIGNVALFHWMVGLSGLVYFVGWLWLTFFFEDLDTSESFELYGFFFVAREVSFAMILLHFGAFLRDYFSQDESMRVFPVVYSAGRLGGVAGGMLLGLLAPVVGLLPLALGYSVLALCCHGGLFALSRLPLLVEQSEKSTSVAPNPVMPNQVTCNNTAPQPMVSIRSLLKTSVLLRALATGAVLFFIVRWLMHYQYNSVFSTHFESEEAMASFLGWYSAWALGVGTLFQMFAMNRVIKSIGVGGGHMVFSGLLLLAGVWNVVGLFPFYAAVFTRLLETEFRVTFRNPIQQIITNSFPKSERNTARAFTMGMVAPLGAAISAVLMGVLIAQGLSGWIGWLALGLICGYGIASIWLARTYERSVKH